MQAVILAGGVGSRLSHFSKGLPKCLIPIGGRPLIKHQLEALADNGAGPVLMVLGYKAEAIREVVGDRAEYIVNERYAETNSLYSLWLAREWIKGPFVLLNSDLFCHPEILTRALEENGSVLAYDSTASRGREQTKVAIRERRVVDLGKDLPPDSARGESLGLLRFDSEGARVFLEQADALIRSGHEQAWVTEAVRPCCSLIHIYGVNVAGLPWVEVDFPYDLEQARKEVWPAIWGSRWKRLIYWNRLRWVVLGAAAIALALAGWQSSSQIGPGSVDWENVTPSGGTKVAVATPDGPQKWWKVDQGNLVTAEVDGGEMLRLEFRALQTERSGTDSKCVAEIALDDKPYDWEVFTGTPDPEVTLPGFVVGDRDRLEVIPPPGRHVLQVSLLAGTCDGFLIRIRQQE